VTRVVCMVVTLSFMSLSFILWHRVQQQSRNNGAIPVGSSAPSTPLVCGRLGDIPSLHGPVNQVALVFASTGGMGSEGPCGP
jgi:hypothetical protein